MNRELKFRARFRSLSTSKECWQFATVNEKKLTNGFVQVSELEQYTGLKDVNGKEIYEGDVLKIEYDHKVNIHTGRKTEQYSQKTIKILFERGSFCYSIIDQENAYFGKIPSAPSSLFTLATEKYKIIGNIYENKELLNND